MTTLKTLSLKLTLFLSVCLIATSCSDDDDSKVYDLTNSNQNATNIVKEASRLEMPHLKNGCIVLVHSTTHKEGVNFIVEWDADKKAQRWTAYRIHKGQTGSTNGSNTFAEDPDLPSYARVSDSNSYYKGSGFDRGHIDFIRKFRWVIGACLGLAGMPNAAQGAAKKIIIADSTDYMEWYGYRHFGTQIRSDGILSSASNIITKVSSLVQRNLYDISLIASDYKYNTDKTDAIVNKYKLKEAKVSEIEKRIPTNDKYWGVLGKLFLAISLCGLIGNVLAGAVFLFDNFTGKRRDQILEELNVERKKRELVMAQVSADAEESAEPAE